MGDLLPFETSPTLQQNQPRMHADKRRSAFIRAIRVQVLWLLAFALTRITALLLGLLLFLLLWLLRLRCWRRSCWRSYTFTLRLLLATLDLLLLSTWLLLLLRLRSLLWLLHATCFTLLLATTSWRLNTRLFLHLMFLFLSTITFTITIAGDGRSACDNCRVVKLLRDSRRDIDLPTTPR